MYFIRWVDAGLLHAGRQVGLTGGIQRDPSCSSIRGGRDGGDRFFRNLTRGSESHCGFRRLSLRRECYSRGRAGEETQDWSVDASEGREEEEGSSWLMFV